MNSKLEIARKAYGDYIKDLVSKNARLSAEEIENQGFAELAEKIDKPEIRYEYCRRAITMLEENLREHYQDRPRSIDLIGRGELSDLREWQRTARSWEAAVLSLELKCQSN